MAFGVVDLGLSLKEFWRLTPRQLRFLSERYAALRREQWAPFAMLASLYANVHRDEKKRPTPFSALDFMPAEAEPEAEKEKTPDQIWYAATMWALAQPGTEIVSRKERK